MTAAPTRPSADRMRLQLYADKNGQATAIVDPGGIRWTRKQVSEKANQLSRALRACGFGSKSVLALIAPNCTDFVVSYLAATQIGMYVVPINWHLATPEIRHIVEDSGANVVVAHNRFRAVIEGVLLHAASLPQCRISLDGAISDFSDLEDFISGFSGDPISDPVQGRVLSYTSATTGRPKGVVLPIEDAARVLDLAIDARIAAGTLPEEHVQICASMLYHGAPLEGVIVGLHMGHTVVLMELPEPEAFLHAVDKYKATMAFMVPSMFVRLLALHESVRARYSLTTLRKVLHAGAVCPIDAKRKMIDWWGPIFWEAYGATEGAGTVVNSEDWLTYPGTVGKPIPGTRLKILGEDGCDLPPGVIGTIFFTRYSGDRFEYLNDPEKTRAIYRGQFFTVGDVGYVNSDGFLFLCDRAIDVINISGSKVYPAELESIICEFQDVSDCTVIGIPDPRFGEAIVAVIRPRQFTSVNDDLKRNLIRWLRAHISIAKLPRYYEFVDEIPRDVTGKVQKKLLRERYSTCISVRSSRQ